jgi:hypothetical protein
MTDPNRPLWQVMADAYIIAHASGNVAHAYAAELRAVVNAMEDHFVMLNGDSILVRDWLLAEADKAEAGGEKSVPTSPTLPERLYRQLMYGRDDVEAGQ